MPISNFPNFQFHMKVMTYLKRLRKERLDFTRRQSHKINLKVFENLKKFKFILWIIIKLLISKSLKNKPKIPFKSLKEAFDISIVKFALIW